MVSRPLIITEPERLPTRPSDASERGGAPGAIAAEQRHDLPAVDVAIHAVQHVGLAVVGVQIRDAQRLRTHRCAPRSSASAEPM